MTGDTQAQDSKTAKNVSSDTNTSKSSGGQTMTTMNSLDSGVSDLVNLKSLAKTEVSNDLFSGALIFNYPIEVPAGRNGQTPNISLSYNSQNLRNGIVGFGWNLTIPYIERLNKTGTNNLYATSSFVSSLDGELLNTSGTLYLARSADTNLTWYNFESNSWFAIAKDGTQYFYGTSTASRVDDPADESRAYRFMLSKVRDPNDNSIIYTYTKSGNQIYPATISYSKNGNETPAYEISFSYVAATSTISYQGGFLVTRIKNSPRSRFPSLGCLPI